MIKKSKTEKLSFRATKQLLEAIETYAENVDETSRSKVIVELIERGLKK